MGWRTSFRYYDTFVFHLQPLCERPRLLDNFQDLFRMKVSWNLDSRWMPFLDPSSRADLWWFLMPHYCDTMWHLASIFCSKFTQLRNSHRFSIMTQNALLFENFRDDFIVIAIYTVLQMDIFIPNKFFKWIQDTFHENVQKSPEKHP